MAAPDMEVIKEIPGYKVILKAVLKSQIQQLVEQLASNTDEETVVLTASVSDGTLSHLGSESGKSFLEEREDMKSQFLGFCLKRHHKNIQQEALKQLEIQSPSYQDSSSTGYMPHLSSGGLMPNARPRNQRHEPYKRSRGRGIIKRGQRSISQSSNDRTVGLPGSEMSEKSVMKSEPGNESLDQSFSDIGAESSVHDSSQMQVQNLANESTGGEDFIPDQEGQGSNIEQPDEQNSSSLYGDVNVKQEAGMESGLDFQVTGMEPGRSIPQDNWGANVSDLSMDMNYDESGATGSSFDMQSGGYSDDNEMYDVLMTKSRKKYKDKDGKTASYRHWMCQMCDKVFNDKSKCRRHVITHTGQKPFQCKLCQTYFSRKDNLKAHMVNKHGRRLSEVENE